MCKAKQYACLHNNFCPTKFLTSGCAQTRKLYLFTPIFKLFSSSISGNSCGEKKYSESRSYTKQYYVTTVKTGQNQVKLNFQFTCKHHTSFFYCRSITVRRHLSQQNIRLAPVHMVFCWAFRIVRFSLRVLLVYICSSIVPLNISIQSGIYDNIWFFPIKY